ncbi:3-oxoacyl-acyl-carrier- reductase [Trichoderma arundinaceum]|uniref:3-oxoacyl-acyl-carrier-reductase n=1 Tax=Trichoderma arundinaceum TaxID=490622 RepID=A0A395NLP8_TRIAR|nr:3-oxoacyl-acyl-carrier- reductase [Trichoderma arundinaceum]
MAPLVFLVTGATSGIGAALVEHILSRGDKVIASGRKVEQRIGHLKSTSDNLALLELDITAGIAEVKAQIQRAWNIFGHIDVLMNNAGMSAAKTVEDADDAYVQNIFQVNVFGQVHTTQAILPLFRGQGHGCVAFTSSSAGWMALPTMSHYSMTKAALSSFAEGLHKEVSGLGIRSVAFDCGGFITNLGQPREGEVSHSSPSAEPTEAYKPLFAEFMGVFATNPLELMPGDPAKAASTMVDVIKGEGVAAGRPWAVRVVLGSDALDSAKRRREEELKLLNDWAAVSANTDGRKYVPRADFRKYTVVTGVEH